MKPVFLPLLVLTTVSVLTAETHYFLVGPRTNSPATDSFVLPLSKPEDLAHARDLIARGPNPGGEPNRATVGATVRGGRDGINLDYLAGTLPEWSWHVESAGFGDVFPMNVYPTAPAQLEAIFSGTGSTGAVQAVFFAYAVIKELGPSPLFVSVVPDGELLQLYWSGLGTNFVYTLEFAGRPEGTNWTALPGVAWPLNTNHWSVALTNAPARFYRVQAEPSPQDVLFRTLDHGAYGGISMATNRVIRSEVEWSTFWAAHQAKHSPPAPVPVVDFNKEIVAAVTMGAQRTGGFRITIERIARGVRSLQCFVTQQSPGTNCNVTLAITTPFHFVALAKDDLDPGFIVESEVISCD